ncbi:MAG: hypothetical protein IT174_01985 [Acidobacteria bacterium]|nr:hypothetical protein [Acidobacteriota bacterium]
MIKLNNVNSAGRSEVLRPVVAKKITAIALAALMMVSFVFIDNSISPSGSSFAAQAQTVTAKRRKKGIIRKSYAGGKWVTRKVWRGGKWVTVKTWKGTKWVGKKSWRTGRKVVSRTKKVVY